jgi:hypothetical protein
MSDNYGVGYPAAALYDPFGSGTVTAGAAGVGVGAAMQRARSRKEIHADGAGGSGVARYDAGAGYGEQVSPYPAFAGAPQVLYNSAASQPGQGSSYGAGGNATYENVVVARGPSQRYPTAAYPDLSRSKSRGAKSLGSDGAFGPGAVGNGTAQESTQGAPYAARYQPGSLQSSCRLVDSPSSHHLLVLPFRWFIVLPSDRLVAFSSLLMLVLALAPPSPSPSSSVTPFHHLSVALQT